MSLQNEGVYHKTALPSAAGIINIVIGAGCVLGALGLGIAGLFAGPFIPCLPFAVPAFFSFLAVPAFIIGILIIVGGVLALGRRHWGWALAASIASVFVAHVLGIISIILLAISKQEFDR